VQNRAGFYRFATHLKLDIEEGKEYDEVFGFVPRLAFKGRVAFDGAVSKQNNALRKLNSDSIYDVNEFDSWSEMSQRFFMVILIVKETNPSNCLMLNTRLKMSMRNDMKS